MGEGFSSGAPGMDREESSRWTSNLGCSTERPQVENQEVWKTIQESDMELILMALAALLFLLKRKWKLN